MALYPYTLQPIPLNLSETEFKQAQLALFEQSSQQLGIKSLKPMEWGVLAVVVALAIAGLVFVDGYSTILFWLMLGLSVGYLLARTLGMKWYMKREFEKRMAETEMPEEMTEVKLGVQKQGLIMSMPTPNVDTTNLNRKGKGKKNRQTQMKMPSHQQAVIPWGSVTSWDETTNYLFVMFEIQGQQGSQIIPKRLESKKFPIETVRKHLTEVKAKGLQADNVG